MKPMTPARALALIKIFNRRFMAGEVTSYEYKRHVQHIKARLAHYREERKKHER